MSKQLTCAEILQEMRKEIPGYPILMKKKGSQKEIAALVNKDETWDIYIYKSHGYIFTKVAKGLKTEQIIDLEEMLKN